MLEITIMYGAVAVIFVISLLQLRLSLVVFIFVNTNYSILYLSMLKRMENLYFRHRVSGIECNYWESELSLQS